MTTNIKEVNEFIQQILNACRDYRKELDDKNEEVARLREELKERIENQNTFAMALIEKPEREVARLRELLNRAIEIADEAITPLQRSEYSMDGDMLYRQLERLRDEVAALAPAPEATPHANQ